MDDIVEIQTLGCEKKVVYLHFICYNNFEIYPKNEGDFN